MWVLMSLILFYEEMLKKLSHLSWQENNFISEGKRTLSSDSQEKSEIILPEAINPE